MVPFLEYKFSINPNFIHEIQDAAKKFDWFDEFVSVNQNGEITLFDISDGNTEDAISQIINELSPEALKTVQCEIIACEFGAIFRFRVENGKIVKNQAIDFVWN